MWEFKYLWPVRVLNIAISVFFKILFIASVDLIIDACMCYKNHLVKFQEESCSTASYYVSAVFGAFTVLFLTLFSLSATLTDISFCKRPTDLMICSTPYFNLLLLFANIFFALNYSYLSKVFFGGLWTHFSNLLLSLALYASLIYFLPYQHSLIGKIRASTVLVFAYGNLMAVISVLMGPNRLAENRLPDLLFMLGMGPVAVIGYFLYERRIEYFRMLANAVLDDARVESVTRKRMSSTGSSLMKTLEENYALIDKKEILPKSLLLANANTYTVEIIARHLWIEHTTLENVEVTDSLYHKSMKAFPANYYLAIAYIFFADQMFPSERHYLPLLDANDVGKRPSVDLRFLLFKRQMEELQRRTTQGQGTEKMDLVAYVEYQKYYGEAKKYHARVLLSIRNFWSLFQKSYVAFEEFSDATRMIEMQTKMADRFYNVLIEKYPKAFHLYDAYAFFLETVILDTDKSEKFKQAAQELQTASKSRNNDNSSMISGESGGGGYETNSVISVNETGKILQANNAVLSMFGYSRKDLIGENVSKLVPTPFKENHAKYMERYKKTREAKVIGKKRELFGLHKNGYVFPISLTVTETKGPDGKPIYIAMVTKCRKADDLKTGCVVIKNDGIIAMVNKRTTEMFGYTPAEMYKRNVKMLMSEDVGIRHDTFISNYVSTGVAKVIGSKGRQVMGKTKMGKMIPLSLEVKEERIDDMQIFVGYMSDATLIAGSVVINVKGIIQSCDEYFSKLTGYEKENLIGENITIIMPYPYSSYHDSYLTRYVETRQGSIVNDMNGRVLQLKHYDGTLMNVNLVVTSIENEHELLFKGTLVRTSAVPVTESSNEKSNITFKDRTFEIVKVGEDVSRMTGYPVEYLTGRSLELIFPPIPKYREHSVNKLIEKSEKGRICYGYMVTETMEVLPVGIQSVTKFGDRVWRLFDLRPLEGVIRITQMGHIKEFSQACCDLFGYLKSEILGHNVSDLMPRDVGDNHDSYMARRVVVAKHRDGTEFPLMLEVVEHKSDDQVEFIGRTCHGPIEDDHVDREWIENNGYDMMIRKEKIEKINALVVPDDDERRVSISEHQEESKGMNESTNNTFVRSNASIEELEQERGNSDEESVNEKSEDATGSIVGSDKNSSKSSVYQSKKIMAIRNGKVPIKSIQTMNRSLMFIFGLLVLIMTSCVILVSTFPDPTRYVIMRDYSLEMIKEMNEIIFYSRIKSFKQIGSFGRANCSNNCIWNNSMSFVDSEIRLSESISNLDEHYSIIYSLYSNDYLLDDFILKNFYSSKLISTSNDILNKDLNEFEFINRNQEIILNYSLDFINKLGEASIVAWKTIFVYGEYICIAIFISSLLVYLLLLVPRLKHLDDERRIIFKILKQIPRKFIDQLVNDKSDLDPENTSNSDLSDEGTPNENDLDLDLRKNTEKNFKEEFIARRDSHQAKKLNSNKRDLKDPEKTSIMILLSLFAISIPSIVWASYSAATTSISIKSAEATIKVINFESSIYKIRRLSVNLWINNSTDYHYNSVTNIQSQLSNLYSEVTTSSPSN
ncbi:hypothetical protein ROZALSC1DRAFT_28444 [Rozella allomycis CSF55]|uniref:PAS domain-containing protein n=1 Tax=Rozella allomycis (strain CSF55) TaxID=988480 RepID=A0A4P9YN33_ROZAC|nr:hypothetical protein ROZALSC1DRAFT_28444 [Rozella allomycis CSF55]